MDKYPRLRPLDYQPVTYEGQQLWLLRDPLQLSQEQLLFPPALAQIVNYCDGRHTVAEIQQLVSRDLDLELPYDTVAHALAQLDRVYLLDNARSQEARLETLASFRALPYRPATLAGRSYAGTAPALRNELLSYSAGDDPAAWNGWRGRGLISPHIDYMRGGSVYARVWQRARAAVEAADLVLMFGTDHNGGPGTLTLTRQAYATPFGPLPTDLALVDRLAEAIGESEAYGLELNHRQEHAIELSAVWLHYIAGDDPPPLVPILCGSFHHFVANGAQPAEDPRLTAFIDTLRTATAGRRVLAVASVDFAHVGPVFGDDYTMTAARRDALAERDRSLIEAIAQGDAQRFYREIATVEDRYRICGFSSIYLMLRYLGAGDGELVAYAQCGADERDDSLVSIAGLLLS